GKPVQLIVIDTLARCFGGNDENDAKDMGAFIEGCDTIKRETGATVLVVHHSGKDDTKGARGSSAFRAALDAEFNVRREGDGGAIILTCTKVKDAEGPRPAAFDL
ncbi:helicase RepA family protein, partial [Klebsiella pneumoniae]|uniref:AAA family ATPase n=1 Tax=Klebsiella pneumoniae TaxID=573 RepID=UPI001C8BD849